MKKFAYTLLLVITFFPITLQAQPIFRGESVEYDPIGKRWFTSDDGTSIIQRDSNGVVSYFGTNLKASHGMEVMGNTLFACEGTTIYGYDLATALQVMQVSVSGSAFLNGLTNNGVNTLYATCFTNKKIFEIDVTSLSFPAVAEIVSATGTKPNGIVFDSLNHRLIFVNWSTNAPIKAVDLDSFAITTLTPTTLGNIDGIDDDGLGHYYVSSWSPTRISRYDTSFTGGAITVTAPGINNPADICYAKEVDTLGIPNGNGPVTFIGFGPAVATQPGHAASPLTVYPNPVAMSALNRGYIRFELENRGPVILELLDLEGRNVKTLISEEMPAGTHTVVLTGLNLSQGVYMLRLQAQQDQVYATERLIVE